MTLLPKVLRISARRVRLVSCVALGLTTLSLAPAYGAGCFEKGNRRDSTPGESVTVKVEAHAHADEWKAKERRYDVYDDKTGETYTKEEWAGTVGLTTSDKTVIPRSRLEYSTNDNSPVLNRFFVTFAGKTSGGEEATTVCRVEFAGVGYKQVTFWPVQCGDDEDSLSPLESGDANIDCEREFNTGNRRFTVSLTVKNR
jgi:hypothetical protein